MKTIELSDESYEFIKGFVKELDTQNCHGTSQPFYYSVRTEREIAVPEGCGQGNKLHWWTNEWSGTEEELKKYCEEQGIDFEEARQECQEYGVDTIDEFENVFFTEKGYNEHMALNAHNYRHSKNRPSFYIRYAFRNPEIEALMKAVREIAGNK